MSSGLPSMFKSPKNKSFDYKPMFFDEQKERKKELERLVEEQRTGQVSDHRRTERLQANISQKWSSQNRSFRGAGSSNQQVRMIAILAVLAGLVWLFFNWG